MKSTTKLFGIVAILAIAIAGIASAALAVPATINEVRMDDTVLTPSDWTSMSTSFQRDSTFDVRVDFTALQDESNVEVRAYISGYEYGDAMSDSTGVFDMTANTDYVKKLTMTLPSDVQTDQYKLRVVISDRNSDEVTQTYDVKLDAARHDLQIVNVGTSDARVKGGSAELVTVRLWNQGQLTESDVKTTVSVPELGISASDYIDSIKSDKQKDTQEMYLRIPTCAKAGMYTLKTDVSYDNGHNSLSASTPFEVVSNDVCAPVAPAQTAPTATVVVQQPVQPAQPAADAAPAKDSTVKTALEVILLVLIGLVVVIGIVLGLSRMGKDDDEAA